MISANAVDGSGNVSNGRRHARYTSSFLMLTFAGGLAALTVAPSMITLALAAGAFLGALAGHLVTPDIDLRWRTHEERRIVRILGLPGYLWTVYWYPYAVLMRHRSWSHTVPQGTLSRILYLAAPVSILAWLVDLRLDDVSVQYIMYGASTFATAWFLQDLSHLTLDGLFPHRAPWRKPAWQPNND